MKANLIPIANISIDDFVEIVRSSRIRLELSNSGRRNLKRGEASVRNILRENKIVYGVNTGIGDLCDVILPEKDICRLQENIIKSHACGSAPYLDSEIARGTLFLAINSLAKGFSGITLTIVEKMIVLFNSGIIPLLPKQGSLGASGDLIPLAHLGLLLLGKGSAYDRGKIKSAASILRRLKIPPAAFRPKEALALINGTEATASQSALIIHGALNLVQSSFGATALLFELTGASQKCLDSDIHSLKPHYGQGEVARILRKLLKTSRLCDRPNKKVQSAYVIRCAPQIDGAIFETIINAGKVAEIELNSVSDNPLFFSENGMIKIVSGGNFHAQNIAFSLDSISIVLAAFSRLMERRIERLLNSYLSGLAPFLVKEGGLNSGLMITQYLAASLVAENSVLAHPASIQSIPVSANQEDFVSMAMTAANKTAQILANCEKSLAVLLLAEVQAMDLMRGSADFRDFSNSSRSLYKNLRQVVPQLENDMELGEEIEKITGRLRQGLLRNL